MSITAHYSNAVWIKYRAELAAQLLLLAVLFCMGCAVVSDVSCCVATIVHHQTNSSQLLFLHRVPDDVTPKRFSGIFRLKLS